MSRKHQKYRRYLLSLVCKDFKNGRRHKLSITHKLNTIEHVLKNGISWTSLNKSNDTKGDESSYRKFFYKLCNSNIFSKAIHNFIRTIPAKVYTDTTTILNKAGRKSDVDYCSKDRKHKGVKISTYCDDNRFIYPSVITKGNVHDVKILEPTLDINLKPKIVVADKGYISAALKSRLRNNGTELIYPHRNYARSKVTSYTGTRRYNRSTYPTNTDREKLILKDRFKIENMFATLKQYRRLNYVYEKNIKYFKGFVDLACYLINSNVGYNG